MFCFCFIVIGLSDYISADACVPPNVNPLADATATSAHVPALSYYDHSSGNYYHSNGFPPPIAVPTAPSDAVTPSLTSAEEEPSFNELAARLAALRR